MGTISVEDRFRYFSVFDSGRRNALTEIGHSDILSVGVGTTKQRVLLLQGPGLVLRFAATRQCLRNFKDRSMLSLISVGRPCLLSPSIQGVVLHAI